MCVRGLHARCTIFFGQHDRAERPKLYEFSELPSSTVSRHIRQANCIIARMCMLAETYMHVVRL